MRPSSILAFTLAFSMAMLAATPVRGFSQQPDSTAQPAADPGAPPSESPQAAPAPESPPVSDTSPQPGWDTPQPQPTQPPPVYQPQQPPPAAQPAPAPRRQRRAGKAMLIAGWTVFGLMYLVSAINGAAAVDCANRSCGRLIDDEDADRDAIDADRRQWGLRMMIPIAGPFAAMPVSRIALTGAWAAILGVLQVTGATLGIVGAVRYSQSGRELSFLLFPAEQGGMLAGRLRF